MNKVYSFLLLPFLFLYAGFECQSDFDYSLDNKDLIGNSITLKLKAGTSEEYNFELYNLNSGDLIAKKSVYFQSGDSKVVFEKLSPATYTVYYYSSNCVTKKSIKGKGIVLQ